MKFDIAFMFIALKAALKYTPITLILAIIPLIIGIFMGTFVAVARLFKIKILGRVLQFLVVTIKGIPLVLQIIIINFAVIGYIDFLSDKYKWTFASKDINRVYIVLIAMTIFSIVNISETIRGALTAIDKGQYEAAYSIGLTRMQALKRIILPQAFPVAVPVLCNNFIGLIKGSSLAFVISVTDLMNGALITATSNYKYLEAYVASAIVYWLICVAIEKASVILEKHLNVYRKEEVI
ncbi:amino acid ABC transporter permease [Clostridium saccharobutylicum]|uniref:L-cystine transport system permease protein TcyM n=1 Tax=Clostridium saccharobutylicum TaxID=169679 RepID=A0A1S8NCY7_CLOSA|nr:amino acid ABC transporter permease [Clostridium saccharobutylicum]OOM14337.1 L-cystine transport system permease protein TcyM [Clostridium saccharobutylicum]